MNPVRVKTAPPPLFTHGDRKRPVPEPPPAPVFRIDARACPGSPTAATKRIRATCLLHARRHSIAPMHELRPGVWHWQSPHPDWDDEQWWPELVSSYAIELGDDFLLFDPVSVPDELRERAPAVVLTRPYHDRGARGLGLPVHTA